VLAPSERDKPIGQKSEASQVVAVIDEVEKATVEHLDDAPSQSSNGLPPEEDSEPVVVDGKVREIDF